MESSISDVDTDAAAVGGGAPNRSSGIRSSSAIRRRRISTQTSSPPRAATTVKLSPLNRDANRVLGVIYAALAEGGADNARRGRGNVTAGKADENLTKAIHYLEVAIDKPAGESDPNVRATLARLYVATSQFDKAIPMLSDLVRQEPGWQDGPVMLAEAYAAAGRSSEAIAWLEEQGSDDPRLLPTLGEFYERERRWSEAAATYGRALQRAPRNTDLRTRYGSALLNAGGHENAVKAREAKLPVYLRAFYPHGYESALLYLFARGLQGRYAYAHVLFDHALDCSYISPEQHDELNTAWQHIGAMLNKMIQHADDFCKKTEDRG